MPSRILRDGIITSPRMAKLSSWGTEVFYRRLHSVVDDYGRYYADPMLLRAACYPRQLNKVSDEEIEDWLADAAKARLLRAYEAEGQSYIELLDFRQQIRAKKSKYPNPPPDALLMPCECLADAEQLCTRDEDEVRISKTRDESAQRARAGAAPVDMSVVAVDISSSLLSFGLKSITPAHPVVAGWAQSGVTAEMVREALRIATEDRHVKKPSLNYITPIIAEMVGSPKKLKGERKPWFLGWAGIHAKAKELGIPEEATFAHQQDYRSAVLKAAGLTKEEVDKAVEKWR